MSLSTLLEAAKYLDYLDSNNHQQNQLQQQHLQQQPLQHQQQHQQPHHKLHPIQQTNKKSARRQRSSKKDAANTMLAMSLPTRPPMHMQGVPIPVVSSDGHQAASLSSSFTTGSPLSSFASTALLCSKASGVTSASSSTASSLSSSESSSSCGEILMGDNDFNQTTAANGSNNITGHKSMHNKHNNTIDPNGSNNNHHNYHLTHHKFETNHLFANQQNSMTHPFNCASDNNHSIARYIAATSAGPQLVTMTTNSTMASSSAPVDVNLRAGHVIHAADAGVSMNAPGSGISYYQSPKNSTKRHYSISSSTGLPHQQSAAAACREGQAFSLTTNHSFFGDNQLSGSPNSCPPLIMARVQPMILNSMSPSAQSIMAFQQATASSPTSSSSSYSRHRELHKTLEKNRRAHLRHCFELLKAELPASECVDKKTSHINIIKSAIRYVLALRQQECEIENELQRLTKIKSELTENLSKTRQDPQKQKQPQLNYQQQNQSLDSQQPQQLQQQQADPQTTTLMSSGVKTEGQSPPRQQQPAAEQQLSFLLSQSKID